MAITFTELTEWFDTANTTSYASNGGTATATNATYTPAANTPCFAVVNAAGSVAASPTFAGNAMTWTLQGGTTWGSGDIHRLYLFTAPGIASPTTTAGTFTCTADAATGVIAHVIQVNGADATTPVQQFKLTSNPTPGTTQNIQGVFDATTQSDCAIYANACNITTPATLPPPSGYTEIMDSGHATPNIGMEAATHTSPGAVTTVSWATSQVQWATCCVEINAPAAGATSLIYDSGMNLALLVQ
jgi:hypothetical protein